MPSKSKIRKIIFWFLVFLYAVQLAQAGEQATLSPNSGHSNQVQINEALKNGDVFLSAGVYEIDGPIYIHPNTKLTLDENAIIRVWKGSSQWFTGKTGIINCVSPTNDENVVPPKNIEISGGEIDGNCDELPSSYNSNDQDPHDCGRGIFLIGSSNDYGENIYIHDIKIYDCFSDGIHVRFSNKVKIVNVFESNCEHEGIYFCVVLDGLIYNCEIAGITSDNIRIENSKRIKVDKCLLYSYTGDHNNGAYEGGEAGIQIGDQGRSFGTGSDKPVHTSDIEVCNTIFANNGRTAVALDIAGKEPSDNVYFHDNQFIGAEELETMGIPVEGFDFGNMPSKEMSEKIFSSIFDILDMEFTDSGRTEQTADDIPLQITENTSGIIAGGVKIVGVKDRIVIDNVSYIPDDQAVLVQTKVIQNPDLSQWTGTIKKIDKNVSVKIKNGTAYATLKVKTSWYTQKKDSVTGKSKKSKLKTSTATFTDTYSPVPDILIRPSEKKGYINEYRSKSNSNTRVYVNPEGLQKVVYEYGGNSSTHTFLVGEKKADETGILYTEYVQVNSWDGNISTFDDSVIIYGDFDPNKLKVTCYTPYENFTVTDFEHSIYSMEKNTWISPQTAFILKLLLMLFCGYKLMRVIIPP